MKVVCYPAEVLRQSAEPIEKIDSEIESLAQEMIKTMYQKKGIGLAAPQVGVSKQLIVVNPTFELGKEVVYINPQILNKKGRVMKEEGCLSFPGIYGNVVRAKRVEVSALLLTGEAVTFEAEEMVARVIQHEIDHLKGVLFVDKFQPAEQVMLKRQLREMEERRVKV